MRLTNHLAKIVLGALVLALSSCSDDRFADNADACMVLPGDRAATIEVPFIRSQRTSPLWKGPCPLPNQGRRCWQGHRRSCPPPRQDGC